MKMTVGSIRVVLIDDHKSMLWGLERLIDSQSPKMQVVGKFTSHAEASAHIKKLSPDVILLDLDLGDEHGLDIIPQLVFHMQAKILVLTGARDAMLLDKALIAGAKGVVEKGEPVETILAAIERVHSGQLWMDQGRMGRIIIELCRQKSLEENDPDRKKIASLTPREREIVKAVTSRSGTTCIDVAKELRVSESTLRNHLSSIYSKLDLTNRLELWEFAHKHALNGAVR
ncbi:MAG: response regulator transcription factor [Nitrosomonadales bacterium]|nr:response regulator transcription factor [Nitrosomonadales bacterium]